MPAFLLLFFWEIVPTMLLLVYFRSIPNNPIAIQRLGQRICCCCRNGRKSTHSPARGRLSANLSLNADSMEDSYGHAASFDDDEDEPESKQDSNLFFPGYVSTPIKSPCTYSCCCDLIHNNFSVEETSPITPESSATPFYGGDPSSQQSSYGIQRSNDSPVNPSKFFI
jgi:hypothetical protein